MLKVGITGGIGSGKSFVAKIFATMGIPVYNSDIRAKELMHSNLELKQGIIELFGEEAYVNDKLNRPYIAKIVFGDKAILQKLNNLVHPAVAIDTYQWFQAQAHQPYALKEAALIFETNTHTLLDKIICVTAPDELRIQRVIERDNTDEAAVKSRMNKQIPQSEKAERSDFVINNDQVEALLPQINRVHLALIG